MPEAGGNPKLNVRQIALLALENTRQGAHVQAALAGALDQAGLAPRERQFCADLVYGSLREQLRLKYIIGKFLPRPEKLPPKFLDILSLGVYGLVSQDYAPAYATINETVKLIKGKFGQRLAGVANGALRSIERKKNELKDPAWYAEGTNTEQRWDGLRVFYGMPRQIASLWKKAWGLDIAVDLMRRSAMRPWTGLRVNLAHPKGREALRELLATPGAVNCGASGVAWPPGEAPENLLGASLEKCRGSGLVAYQAPGSMLVMEELGLGAWRRPVWDCCAGFGGKTAWLAERGASVALATDTSRKRLAGAQYSRPHMKRPLLAVADAAMPPLSRWDGHIIADVPCSGLGVLARRPDIRHKSSLDFEEYARKQKAILESSATVLAPGNELAYITCTLNPAENEEMIASFLDARPDMELSRQWQTPHGHPWLEGMYGALMRKNGRRA